MPPKDRLVSEIAWVRGQCEPLASPVVFCHNDLSQSNVLFDPPTQRLAFIDFELCQYNYQAIDFAHLFSFKGLANRQPFCSLYRAGQDPPLPPPHNYTKQSDSDS